MNGHLLISGPSASGKSTLARAAANALQRPLILLDNYFIPEPRRFVKTASGLVRNYEDPRSYDGDEVARLARAHPSGAVLEGFCLLAYPSVMSLPGLRFYLDVPFDVCVERRRARRPQRRSDASFFLIGRDETARHVESQKHLPGVVVINGMLPISTILAQVLDACRKPAGA